VKEEQGTRKRIRPTLVLAMVFMLTVGVSACGGGSGKGESTSTSGQSKLSGTVTVWDFEYEAFPEYTEAVNQLDSEFEKLHPGVKVDRVAQPYESYEAIYRAAFTAHEGPDAMVMQPGAVGVLSFKKGLEVLNDRITPEMEEHLTQWQSVTPDYTVDGDHYGVPIGQIGFVFYYNKKMFAEAGLPTDFEPKSWEEVREAGEQLKAAGIQPFTGGNKEGLENQWWFSMGFHTENTPQQAVELADGELPYTDEAVTKAFGPLIEMQEAGLYPADRFSTSDFTEGFPRFAEGKGAMILGLWNTVGYWGEFNPKLGEKNVGMFFAPSSSVELFGSICLSIPTFAENKDAAWALVEYETSKKGIEVLNRVGGLMPNRTDVSLPPDAAIQERELVKASRERETVLAPIVVVPSSVVYGPFVTEMNEVLQGRMSLEDAQKSMQETAEKTSTE
jgi:ABC-type glycerol-3-phosphate transport system substrate-binding protein